MNHFRGKLALLVALAIACPLLFGGCGGSGKPGDGQDDEHTGQSLLSEKGKSPQTGTQTPKQVSSNPDNAANPQAKTLPKTNGHPAPDDGRLYEGRTIDQWIALLGDKLHGAAASEVLKRIGIKATPALAVVAEGGNRTDRIRAIGLLGEILRGYRGEPPAEVVSVLVRGVSDSDTGVRNAAVTSIRDCGPWAKPSVPGLVKIVEDRSLPNYLRRAALINLELLKADAADAVPTVGRLVNSEDQDRLRDQAVRTLQYIAAGDPNRPVVAAVRPLVSLLGARFEDRRRLAFKALGELRRFAVPALVEGLDDASREVRFACRELLLAGGAASVPELIKALESRILNTRRHAIDLLGRIGPPAKAALVPLARFRDDDDPATRKLAARAISAIRGEL